MEFKKLDPFPSLCPKILIPLWIILIIVFYILYIPIYFVIWLFLPKKRKKKSLITLDADYRLDRH